MKKELVLRDKQRKVAGLESSWAAKSAKIEETDGRLKASRTETQAAICQLKAKVSAT